MKVGIVTLNGTHNYGNRLQLYACATIYEHLGYTPIALIPQAGFYTNDLAERACKRHIKHLLGRHDAPDVETLGNPERLSRFERFSALVPSQTVDSNSIMALKNEIDIFSVGSDQVWNPQCNRYLEDWYYLQFADPQQRIALAPSIGLDELNKKQSKRLFRGVRGFDYPSVREKRGAELIKECSGVEPEVICDPTLALRTDEWRSIAGNELTPDVPYVLSYLLGGENDVSKDVLEQVTDRGQLPVIALTDRDKPGEVPAGPAEFIGLIDHAKHVVTDSFHAAVFSCLMQTPLTIVRRGGEGSGMFSRLETLAETLGIEEKIYGSDAFDMTKASCYTGVTTRIEGQREHFLTYLNSRLGRC